VSEHSGINAGGVLGIVFVTLKLTGHIDWSWWWVTLPFWWFLAAIGLVAILALIWRGVSWAWLAAKGGQS